MKNKEHFAGVVGYDAIVTELKQVCAWLKDEKLRSNPDFYLPRGILLHGRPGNGKTMLARELVAALGAPVVTIEGNTGNVSEEIRQAFQALRTEKFAVLFIDEIDLLIEKSETAVRILQSEMDGFVVRDSRFFAIATTNYLRDVPQALRRSGRFDRIIELGNPNRAQLVELYRYYAAQSGLTNIDFRFLSQITGGVSCADTRSIINDAALRKGLNATTEDVEDSYNRIINQVYKPHNFKDTPWFRRVAIHEVGHAVMIKKHEKFLKFYRANFADGGGICHVYRTNEEEGSYDYLLADTEIALGGYYAEKLILGDSSLGVTSDLERARGNIASLVNKQGFVSPLLTLPNWAPSQVRSETEPRRRTNEKVQKRIFRKIAKRVKKHIAHNKSLILELSAIMLEKGYIKNEDVEKAQSKALVVNTMPNVRLEKTLGVVTEVKTYASDVKSETEEN